MVKIIDFNNQQDALTRLQLEMSSIKHELMKLPEQQKVSMKLESEISNIKRGMIEQIDQQSIIMSLQSEISNIKQEMIKSTEQQDVTIKLKSGISIIKHELTQLPEQQKVSMKLQSEISNIKQELMEVRQTNTITKEKLALASKLHSDSIQWLTTTINKPLQTQHKVKELIQSQNNPVVSIIMPVWNREKLIEAAIESIIDQTYDDWELLITDDGSTDNTAVVIKQYLHDKRIHYIYHPHKGVSASRNLGLKISRGEIIAYLDSDNFWYPNYLKTLVDAFNQHPEYHSIYQGQLIVNKIEKSVYIRGDEFNRNDLENANYIDLNIFSHRRILFEKYGGFDENIARGEDWDLMLRYTKDSNAELIHAIGGCYQEGDWERITTQVNHGKNTYLVKHKFEGNFSSYPLRILCLIFADTYQYESAIQAEISYFQRRGLEIHVWTASNQHREDLTHIIQSISPDHIFIHLSSNKISALDTIKHFALPTTIHCHQLPKDHQFIFEQLNTSFLKNIFLQPHMISKIELTEKIQPLNPAFNGNLYFSSTKEKKIVLTIMHTPSKEYLQTFINIAKLCPNYQFLLVLRLPDNILFETFLTEININRERVYRLIKIQIASDYEEIVNCIKKSTIYLHCSKLNPFTSIPPQIIESIANGCHVISKNCETIKNYLAEVVETFESHTEAVRKIIEFENLSEKEWGRKQNLTIDHAYNLFADIYVLNKILEVISSDSSRIKSLV